MGRMSEFLLAKWETLLEFLLLALSLAQPELVQASAREAAHGQECAVKKAAGK